MGHSVGKLLNPKEALEAHIDPAGSVVRNVRGVPTTARTIADPGNAVWPQAADPVNYGNPGSFQQPQMSGPFIDPKTNMRAGAPVMPGQPSATSIGSLGGKNQIPMPAPQTPQLAGPQVQQRYGIGPTPTGQQAM